MTKREASRWARTNGPRRSCRDCRGYFNVRYGTMIEHSNLPHRTWFVRHFLMSTSLKGVSSTKLHRDLGVTQKTAWMLTQKIRTGGLEANTGCKLSGTSEVDESYIGRLEKNKHRDKKLRASPGTAGKFAVVGIRNRRTRQVYAEAVADVTRGTLQNFVRRYAEPGPMVHSDEAPSYAGMPEFHRASVAHSGGEHVRDATANGGNTTCRRRDAYTGRNQPSRLSRGSVQTSPRIPAWSRRGWR